MTKTGWLKCQWCGASPPPDDSPLLGKSRTNMGDLNLLTQLSTCFVLFCDWRIGTHQFSLHTLCFRFLLQLESDQHFRISYHANSAAAVSPIPTLSLELDLSQTAKMTTMRCCSTVPRSRRKISGQMNEVSCLSFLRFALWLSS